LRLRTRILHLAAARRHGGSGVLAASFAVIIFALDCATDCTVPKSDSRTTF